MKKIISMILVFALLASTVPVTFAEEIADDTGIVPIKRALRHTEESCIRSNGQLLQMSGEEYGVGQTLLNRNASSSSVEYSFDGNLLTKFNTVTSPIAGNGANEPKFSYNSFLEENISDYSGELTLNFEDLVLDGRNGLDLRIGRTYQSVAMGVGEKTLMILPDENGILRNTLVNNYSSYLLDRYNLGAGWSFSFPSVQIETEYIPAEIQDTYYYEEETELYYHSGNGEVYLVQFTADTTDSNLKGYYGKDIQFNKNDSAYSNGQKTSYYSLTTADKTKQYFAEDGRLIGIVDRFGNTIKFEHTATNIANRVPEGNFRYDNNVWTVSSGNGNDDAMQVSDCGRNDSYSMYFTANNTDESYLISRPLQVKPETNYTLGVSVKAPTARDVKIEVILYNTAYGHSDTKTLWIRKDNYEADTWYDFSGTFSTSTAARYAVIKISPENAKYMYIDNVTLDEPKPLISKITDTIGRTVTFAYEGTPSVHEAEGSVTITVTSPDGANTRTLIYGKEAIESEIIFEKHSEQRVFWYLKTSNTEGADGSAVSYLYEGGATVDADDKLTFAKLYMNYTSKNHSTADLWFHKPVLSHVKYKDRRKVYEYETVRKNLGDDGYYDTLRIKKKYDQYAYYPGEGENFLYRGELGTVNYSYSGTYNGNNFHNETGYPNYEFDDETSLGELWTVTKSGKSTDTVTFSNGAIVQQTSISDGVTVTSDYTNHNIFKNSPTQIKNTVTENGDTRESYILYSYNDWGGVASVSQEVNEDTKNNTDLLAKYTITYEYEPQHHFVTKKNFYYDLTKPQVSETYTYGSNGVLQEYENAEGETTSYYYENASFPFLLTKTVQDDAMGFHNVTGGDSVTHYGYDTYGLYPVSITTQYDGKNAQTTYEYDYITGDLLKETLPDNSSTQYVYYSDGRVKYVYSPYSMNVSGNWFYTIENHQYTDNVLFENYDPTAPVYSMDEIYYYYALSGAEEATLYKKDVNFYDAVGNLKMSFRYGIYLNNEDGKFYSTFKSMNFYYHDTYDRLIKTVDNEENTVMYAYDGFDHPKSVTDSEGNVYTYAYDAVANTVDLTLNGITETTDRHLMTQHFDLYGNTVRNTVYPSASEVLSESYEYNLAHNMTSYTDPKGNKTEYEYDALGRLTETILPNGVKATSAYSAFGMPSFEKIYDADGTEKSSRISYRNEKGDLEMSFFSYDGLLTEGNGYSYDANGRVSEIREGENHKTVLYDGLSRVRLITSGESELHRRYNQFGETLCATPDNSEPYICTYYDYHGRVNKIRQNGTYSTIYEYSSIDNIIKTTSPSERIEEYTYTANGNLDTITTEEKIFNYDYYDTGYIKDIIYPNGLQTSYEYDNINRVTQITTTKGSTTINTFTYEYDGNGNVTKETRNNKDTLYTYDSLDRLLSVTYADGTSVSYAYDALNNRTRETYSNGDVKEYIYNQKNQLKEVKLNGEVTDTYTYNASGAVTSHNDETYTYNEWDRMTGYSDGTDSYTYQYNGNGIRTQKNDRQYIVDIRNNVIAETDETGAITEEILWGHQPLARKTNGSWYYYIYNAHGDVVGLVNDAGTVVNTYEYDPWGNILSETETVENPIKYAGEYYDEELDMYYLRARYYDPNIGRFTSYDIEQGEISNPLDMNRYVYCRNNPVKYVDPSGETLVLAGIALTKEVLVLLGAGIMLLGYLSDKVFIHVFTGAINAGKTIRDSIIYAKGKAKAPTPPEKLKNGDKVKTPDTHPDEFKKNKDGSYTHKKTKWRFNKDYSRHGGDHWDASPNGKSGNYINVNPNGTIR